MTDSRRTRCVNDTNGDGDCAACSRLGDAAPCRVPRTTRVFKDLLERQLQRMDERAHQGILDPGDVVLGAEQRILARYAEWEAQYAMAMHKLTAAQYPDDYPEAGVVQTVPRSFTYDDLVRLLKRVYDEPYRVPDVFADGALPGETRAEAKARMFQRFRYKDDYHRTPRQYVQGLGGGLPYDTNNWAHFYARYGAGRTADLAPSVSVGIWVSTIEAMTRGAQREALTRVFAAATVDVNKHDGPTHLVMTHPWGRKGRTVIEWPEPKKG